MRKILFVLAGVLLVASPAWADTLAENDATSSSNSTSNALGVGQASVNSANSLAGVGTVTGGNITHGVNIVGSTNLPTPLVQVNTPNSFSQPYKPPQFLNSEKFRVTEMTYAQASDCRDGDTDYAGRSEDASKSIMLFYDKKTPPIEMTMKHYIGSVMATGDDLPYIAVLCEAAYELMGKGATHALVKSMIRPKNSSRGFGVGVSSGFSGLPASGANPYAIAASPSIGMGWNSINVEGEVMIELTGFLVPKQVTKVSKSNGTNGYYGASFDVERDVTVAQAE